MNFSDTFKVFQINILRQAGITVSPEQIGLKSDPIADLQAKSSQNTFSQLLGQMTGSGNGLTVPTAPTPPEDPTDKQALLEYHQALTVYNNESQLYNQKYMQMMLNRMMQFQQQMSMQAQQSNTQNKTSTSSQSGVSLGIGGILGGMDS